MGFLEWYAAAISGIAAFQAVEFHAYRKRAEHAIDVLTEQVDRAQGDACEALSRAKYCEERVFNLELPYRARTRAN